MADDSFLGPIGSALISTAGGIIANRENAAAQGQANLMSADLQFQSQVWNAQQAAVARDWSVQQMQNAEAYNTAQAQNQDVFQEQQQSNAEAFDASMQNQQIVANQAAVANQQAYETAMSNTAYQRSVADMKAAGLNPVLGVASGGASTPSSSALPTSAPTVSAPSGAAGSISTPGATYGGSSALAHIQAPRFGDVLTPAVSTGLDVYRGLTAGQQAQAQISNIQADTLNKAAQGDYLRSQTANQDAQTALTKIISGFAPQRIQQEIDNLKLAPGLNAAQVANLGAQAQAAAGAGASAMATADFTRYQKNFYEANKTAPGVTMPSVYTGVANQAGAALTGLAGQASSAGSSIYNVVRDFLNKVYAAPSAVGAPGPTHTPNPDLFYYPPQ